MNRKTMTLIGRTVFIRYVLPGSLLVTLMFATGCAGGANVKVNVNIPDPLVQSVPIRMGIYYDENLLNYLHEEDLDFPSGPPSPGSFASGSFGAGSFGTGNYRNDLCHGAGWRVRHIRR